MRTVGSRGGEWDPRGGVVLGGQDPEWVKGDPVWARGIPRGRGGSRVGQGGSRVGEGDPVWAGAV